MKPNFIMISTSDLSDEEYVALKQRAKGATTKTIACLRAEIERLHTLNEQQKFLVHGIVEAITNKGSHPDYHDRTLNKQRRLHPTLWNSLDKLVRLVGAGSVVSNSTATTPSSPTNA